jgi:hypothetical protein
MITWVLIELLPQLLPCANAQVNPLVNLVRMDSGNGYDLMWCLLAFSMPDFDPSIPVKLPSWNHDDIFNFALFILYFWLQAKKDMVQDDHSHSTMFLNSIDKPMYAKAIRALQLCITNHTSTLNDWYLPSHLCLMGLANQINTYTRTRAHIVILHVRRTLGMEVDMAHQVPIQRSPFAACLNAGNQNRAPHWEGRGYGLHPSGNRHYLQGVVAAAARLRHAGVMHVRIEMVVHTSPTKFALPVSAPIVL